MRSDDLEKVRASSRASSQRWRLANPGKVRAYRHEYFPAWYARRKARDPGYLAHQRENLKRSILNRTLKRYGLAREEYEHLVGLGCAICGGSPNGTGRYHFDHDHNTGQFRGLLCSKCNTGIGQFDERIDVMLRAVTYLTRTHPEIAVR